jgi:hypothetical protein
LHVLIPEFQGIPRDSYQVRCSVIQESEGISRYGKELDEMMMKFDSRIDETDSECGTGSVMFNIAE